MNGWTGRFEPLLPLRTSVENLQLVTVRNETARQSPMGTITNADASRDGACGVTEVGIGCKAATKP